VDSRGYFQELFHEHKYPEVVKPSSGISQISLSHSVRGVLRGIHRSKYSKLVTAIRGTVYDVVVDLRTNSPTYLRWCAIILSSVNRNQLHIPAGCGHGFLCLQDSDVLYLQGGCFNPRSELDVSPFDANLDIYWPKLEDIDTYIMSDKDKRAPNLLLHEEFVGTVARNSPRKRVLIIGASGQVGGALVEAFGRENVIGTYSNNVRTGMIHFDLEAAAKDPEYVKFFITLCRPETVCICAGRTWVDGCENEGDLPFLVNRDAPRMVARFARACGGRTIFFSTDYVFDGEKEGQCYTESDVAMPLNIYGSSKLAGELAVMEEDPAALVIRTSGVFGPEHQGKNFVYQLCRSLSQKREMDCATDAFGCPTYNRDLAAITVGLLDIGASGIFHCVGPSCLSRYDFALRIAHVWGLDSMCLRAKEASEIYLNTRRKLGFAAKRGKHFGLCTSKLLGLLSVKFHLRTIDAALAHWKDNPMSEACAIDR
jgi:dTDP-4-dehydrorhamnose reductase/dTDP-4-dehydrorhamnose 3,5-epimerase